MKELEKLLKIDSINNLCPGMDGKNFIEIRCYCSFEGHGKSSEQFEKHWELILPQQQAHWKSTKGWKPCTVIGLKQKFHGKTFDEVVNMAKQFLIELKDNA